MFLCLKLQKTTPTYLHVIWKVYFGVVKRERNITNVNGSLWGEMGLAMYTRDVHTSATTNLWHHQRAIRKISFLFRADISYIGATSDGVVQCKCHSKRSLEIKYPYRYRDGLEGWESDSSFPLNSELTMKPSHHYNYQIPLSNATADVCFWMQIL